MASRRYAKALLVSPEGKILILRRSSSAPKRPLELDLPGGTVENDETFQTGVIREIKEETDVDFADDEIELIHAHTAYYQGKTSFLFLYIGYLKQQEVRLSNEHDEQYFMSLDEVLDQFKHPGWRHGIEYAAQHILA